MVRVAAHAHAHQLDERGTPARAGPLDRPRERRGDRVRIGAVEGHARHAVARGLVGEHPDGRLLADRCRQGGLVVLHAEDGRQPSCGAQVDGFVPFPQRGASLADERQRDAAEPLARERQRHPRNRQASNRERRGSRQDAVRQVAHVQVFAVHRRPGLRHLRRQHHPHRVGRRPHRQRDAEVANDRRDHVAVPAVRRSVLVPSPEADAGGVDRFLSERTESLSLERRVAVPHLARREEGLQAGVGRAREHHPLEHLEPLGPRQPGLQRRAPQAAVARLDYVVHGDRQARRGGDAGRHLGVGQNRRAPELLAQEGRQGVPQRLDRRLAAHLPHPSPPQGFVNRLRCEGVPLEDEQPELSGGIRQGGRRRRHGGYRSRDAAPGLARASAGIGDARSGA